MKNLKVFLLLIFLVGIGVGGYMLFGNYSDGFRAGTMIKFSKKGFVAKTYEGQLNLGMVINESGNAGTPATASNIWNFSVDSGEEEVVQTLEDALLSGKRVKVHYKEKFFTLFFRGDTKYFVYKAEVLK